MERDEMFDFRKNALLANLCNEWDMMWVGCGNDKEKLMQLALMQQSAPYLAHFCYHGIGLSKEYIEREFKDCINGRVFNDCDGVGGYTYGMYVNAIGTLQMPLNVVQILWCDNLNVVVPITKAIKMYVSNKSKVSITCDGYNSIIIMLFDESIVYLDDVDEESNVTIYKYSDNCEVVKRRYCLGKVKEFRKELKL